MRMTTMAPGGLLVLVSAVATGCATREDFASQPAAGTVDTVYVIPGSHLDLGFTAPLSEVRAQRVNILDLALEAAERDSAFVWFEEGGWAVEAWLQQYRGDPSRIARLRRLVSNGQIGVGATLLSPHLAAFPEVLGPLTLHMDGIERELGARPSVAVLNDVPSGPEVLLDALSAAGVRYLLVAPNMSFTAPLPRELVRRPFYWESARGARILTFVDPDGFTAGFERWGLPPSCARFFSPNDSPRREVDDDGVVELAVRAQLPRLPTEHSLTIVQHSLDNWLPDCATELPVTVRRWNSRAVRPHFVVSTPEAFFRRIESTDSARIPVLRGEWGGDWDAIRATEPVWTWRLREAGRAISPQTERDLRLAFVAATDHNVGLGPRWRDGMGEDAALRHVDDVHGLYRQVVGGLLGEAGLTALPEPLRRPPPQPWLGAWRELVGAPEDAVHIRAGPPVIGRLVDGSGSNLPFSVEAMADPHRLLVRVRIDRSELERLAGPWHVVVLEVALRRPRGELALAPESSASGMDGRWLLGSPPRIVVAPEGVRILSSGVALQARGPMFMNWSLEPDQTDTGITWLQAHVLTHAVQGTVRDGERRWSFATLYPGEPEVVDFELELQRLP